MSSSTTRAVTVKTPLINGINDNDADDVEKVEPPISKNVHKMFLYNFVDGAAFSVWQAQVLQVLVYQLSGNTAVGWVSGVAGVTQMVSALVAGYAADLLKKEIVCRAAALCGLVGVIVSIYGVYALCTISFYIGGAIWGVYMGLANSSSEALFADSISSGRRAAIYNKKWIIQILCWCVGYVMCLILFLKLGDTWQMDTMQTVMYVGLGMHPLSLICLSLLTDRDSLKNDVSLVDQAKKKDKIEPAQVKKDDTAPTERSVQEEIEAEEKATSTLEDPSSMKYRLTQFFTWHKAPYFVCFGDFIMALGSGMTMRYIPLFFVNDYNVSPSLLMGIFITISVATSACAVLVKHLAERYVGRVPSILCIRLTGTTLLMYMAVVPQSSPGAVLGVMLAVFVARNACMNSTLGISRSVIMDCVNKDHRAKWAAVESFSSFTWAGSATLGGYLADAHGYKYTFLITAIMHFIGSAMLVPAWLGTRRLEDVVMRRAKEKRDKEAEGKRVAEDEVTIQNRAYSVIAQRASILSNPNEEE